MRKFILYTFMLVAVCLCGCEKAPINSDVEGFWKVRKITVLSTGDVAEHNDIYYGITRMVTELSGGSAGSFISRTEYRDNETKLVLRDFKVRGGTGDTGENVKVELLQPYGINSQEETVFEIVMCNGKKMTLQSDYSKIELEKF